MNALVREISKPTLLLAGFAVAGTLLLAGVHNLTAKQIAERHIQFCKLSRKRHQSPPKK